MALSRDKASANPTKAFFVRMITRDIALEDCILDLIDNSVDGAWQLEGAKPMSLSDSTKLNRYKISIETSSSQFRIVDNCGGIRLDDAADYAFTFGRKDSEQQENTVLGYMASV